MSMVIEMSCATGIVGHERPRRRLESPRGVADRLGIDMTDGSTERWMPVVGFEGFIEVSDLGRLRSVDRTIFIAARPGAKGHWRTHEGSILRQFPHPRGGYMYVQLSGGRKIRNNAKVHHLVLEAFVGPRPEGMECCHANDVADDNRLVNLRWDTREGNVLDVVALGKRRWSHCKRGHELTPENTKHIKGGRRCRECTLIAGRESYRRSLVVVA